MTGSSVLPATIHKGKIYFLFGKECEKENSAKGFSDFGGGVEKGEDIYNTALREGGEELTGFLGDEKDIRKHIDSHGGVYPISHNDRYHVHIFFLEYDENLPKYYNANHRFLWNKMDTNYLAKTKLFEKIEIQWFSVEDMKRRKSEFRGFYQEIVDHFLQEMPNIKSFLRTCTKTKKPHRKTQRQK